jgi:hypothetical protein
MVIAISALGSSWLAWGATAEWQSQFHGALATASFRQTPNSKKQTPAVAGKVGAFLACPAKAPTPTLEVNTIDAWSFSGV